MPSRVNVPSSARFRLGPDLRKALGPAVISAAPTGRTRDRTRPNLHPRHKALAKAPSTRDPSIGIVLLAATNRPEILDPAVETTPARATMRSIRSLRRETLVMTRGISTTARRRNPSATLFATAGEYSPLDLDQMKLRHLHACTLIRARDVLYLASVHVRSRGDFGTAPSRWTYRGKVTRCERASAVLVHGRDDLH